MQAKGIQFMIKWGVDMPDVILSDERRIKQVIINLISNALKFTSQGSIIVEASFNPENSQIMFSVTDTGIGIKKSDQVKLFQMFGKLRSSS